MPVTFASDFLLSHIKAAIYAPHDYVDALNVWAAGLTISVGSAAGVGRTNLRLAIFVRRRRSNNFDY